MEHKHCNISFNIYYFFALSYYLASSVKRTSNLSNINLKTQLQTFCNYIYSISVAEFSIFLNYNPFFKKIKDLCLGHGAVTH